MSLPQKLIEAVGFWSGDSTLHLSWLPKDKQTEKSASAFHIDLSKDNVYAVINYTWSYQGKGQEGHIILSKAPQNEKVSASWLDTWHMSNPTMHLNGSVVGDNKVSLNGKYSVGNSPEWGWRIDIILVDSTNLQMKMTNIMPDGKEDWAVEANYKKN